ncbi:hypothetical protein PA0017 [Candidatus Phytoplasma australiense]|uniref:Uncharacterized protein n=1 Tax=Phytoplasma australiense TaxID=59748 RepID=B1V8W5_PHYAS|nr:hypothetical protein PA0017 [Candidatus Phytoplasma australiense]
MHKICKYTFESYINQEEFTKLKILFTYNLKKYFILKIHICFKNIIEKRWSILWKILQLILFSFFPSLRFFGNFIKML